MSVLIAGCSSTAASTPTPDASVAGPAPGLAADPLDALRASGELRGLLARADRPRVGEPMSERAPSRLARPHVDVTLPTHAAGAVHLEVTRDFFLDVSATTAGAVDVPAEAGEHAVVYRGAAPGTDVVHLAALASGEARFEELRVLADRGAPRSVRYRVTTGAAVSTLRQTGEIVEALDGRERAWLRMPAAFVIDAHGARVAAHATLSGGGHDFLVEVSFDDAGLAYPIVLDPAWLATGAMAYGRVGPATATLWDGRVFVAGGSSDTSFSAHALNSTEIYDPTTGTFTLGPTMSIGRAALGAATGGKRVLVAGVFDTSVTSVEVFDFSTVTNGAPVAGVPAMAYSRVFPLVASLAAAGGQKVLVAGGANSNTTTRTDGELYDLAPATPTKAPIGSALGAGADNHAIALTKGFSAGDAQVLIVGATTATYLYDATNNQFSSAGTMSVPHCFGAVTQLGSGNVLVAGGFTAVPGSSTWTCSGSPTNIVELYSYASKSWSVLTGTLPKPVGYPAATTIPAFGTAPAVTLLAGGSTNLSGSPGVNSVQAVNEATGSLTAYGALSVPRVFPAMVGLSDGTALVLGGAPDNAAMLGLPTAERSGAGLAQATTCTGSGQCASGYCVDGVCCDTACNGACQACGEPGSVGTCVTVSGAPRGARTSLCNSGSTGDPKCGWQCDGVTPGACTLATNKTVCAIAVCSASGQYSTPVTCPGGGNACGAPVLSSCAPYGCTLGGCKTSCTSDTDCVGGGHCDTTVPPGVCRPNPATVANGAPATSASQCKSGFLADGVCCATACTGACTSCSISGSVGTCTPIADGLRDPHGSCAVGACSRCKAGACAIASSGTACGVTACTNATLTTAGTCNGTSALCQTTPATACPGLFGCSADGAHCNTLCASNADCAAGVTCDTSSGHCGVPVDAGADAPPSTDGGVDAAETTPDTGAADLGVADAISPAPFTTPTVAAAAVRCVRNADCSTGHCVEGVCCDTACDEPCHSCALLPTLGKCTVEPLGTDLRNSCGPSLSCLGTCDGNGSCIGAGPGSMCARSRCTTTSSGVGPAYCANAGSSCDVANVGAFDCSPFVCVSAFGACATTCVTSDDCANGFICDVTAGKCVTPAAGAAPSSGGCAVSPTGEAGGAPITMGAMATLLAVLAGAAARRSRRSR